MNDSIIMQNGSMIKFNYRNHNGKTTERTVTPDALEFISTVNFGYQPGWYLSGWDHDKKARRSFRLSNIIFDDTKVLNQKLVEFVESEQ